MSRGCSFTIRPIFIRVIAIAEMLCVYAHIHISGGVCMTQVLSFAQAPEYFISLIQIQQDNAESILGFHNACF